MNKPMYKSKTVFGGALWALDIFLTGLGVKYPMFQPVIQAVGTLLVVWGIRDALPDKK